jgi:hypothetical protein
MQPAGGIIGVAHHHAIGVSGPYGPPDGIKKKRAEVADKLQKKLAV